MEGRAISGSQNFLHAKYTLKKTKNFPPAAGRGILRLANIPQKFSACGGPKDFLSKKFLALRAREYNWMGLIIFFVNDFLSKKKFGRFAPININREEQGGVMLFE